MYTLSAIQVLAGIERLHLVRAETVEYIVGLQREDGSFMGDEWGEVDIRFSYCAVSALSLLGRLDRIDTKSAMTFDILVLTVQIHIEMQEL